MKPCISEACILPSSFADDLAAFGEGGCPTMEVWLTKLETHLQTNSIDATRAMIDDRGLTLPVAAFQGGLLVSEGEQRKAHFDHFRRRLDLCAAFGMRTLILSTDFTGRIEPTNVERAIASLSQAAQWAQAFDIRLAVECSSRSSFCSSLDTTLSFLAACGQPNVGVCLDLFHFYTGPSKFDDLLLLNPNNLFHVQVCDLAGVARELADDRDRIFPGEGDFRLEPIFDVLRRSGYDGVVSLELFNPTLWQVKPGHVIELGIKSLERLLNVE